ncbi:hypothetical protein [Amycolatopsis sp. cmx-11-12]|uniref:hypothetical protein n=1 Tax=Amycolatopsis sp. cmx-11-12 TaxID=2785795 RepID=UPI003916E72A
MKLNIPPVSPNSRRGASDQVIDARPFPKKATDRITMTIAVESVKLAPTMTVLSSSPAMIGPLRATLSEAPRRTRKPDFM